MLRIPYDTDDFPTATVANGHAELTVTWDDILWAAVTVGRPNRHYVFRHGVAYSLHFYWRDPSAESERGLDVSVSSDTWMYYYEPVLEAIQSADPDAARGARDNLVAIEGADVKVGVHPAVGKYLGNRQWERAKQAATEAAAPMAGEGYRPDGLKVVADESWAKRFTESGMNEEG